MNSKKFVIYNFISVVILAVFNIVIVETRYTDMFGKFNASIFEPLLVSISVLAVCGIILLFFSEYIFKNWLKYILSWFIPVGFVVIYGAATSGSFLSPTGAEAAVVLGVILVGLTLFFALGQRFYFKVK